jgi:hypothetical protein
MNEATTTSAPVQPTDAAFENAKARSMETIAQIVRKVREDDWQLTLKACEAVRQVERKIAAANLATVQRAVEKSAEQLQSALDDARIAFAALLHSNESLKRERDALAARLAQHGQDG